MKVIVYNSNYYQKWNDFITKNPHTTFLFHRNFMEYHRDRFQDFSFLIFENDDLIGVCPANIIGEEVFSHQGLTYGGLLLDIDFESSKITEVFESVLSFLKQHQITYFNIKSLPKFYDDKFLKLILTKLINNKAEIYRTDKVLAIDYSKPFTIHKTKLKKFRKNKNKGFVIEEVEDFSIFWNNILIPRLKKKHNVKPVHTLDEIQLLNSRFPNKIKQFNIKLDDEVLAGITIFDKGNVVKSQYGATTKKGEQERALEYLFLHLIYKYKDEGKTFFSMGTVTENNELGYNIGLLKQKEELGCSIFLQDFYKLKLS